MYNSPGIWIVLISITVGIGSELYFFQSLFFINVSMDMWKRERKGLLPLPPLGPRHHFYGKKLKFLKIFFILYHIQFFRFVLN